LRLFVTFHHTDMNDHCSVVTTRVFTDHWSWMITHQSLPPECSLITDHEWSLFSRYHPSVHWSLIMNDHSSVSTTVPPECSLIMNDHCSVVTTEVFTDHEGSLFTSNHYYWWIVSIDNRNLMTPDDDMTLHIVMMTYRKCKIYRMGHKSGPRKKNFSISAANAYFFLKISEVVYNLDVIRETFSQNSCTIFRNQKCCIRFPS